MELKITTLIENNSADSGELLFEHGLSLYIETEGKKILFDTGLSGDFIKNAQTLNKSLNQLDYCIISHGHYDHSGGVENFLNKVKKIPQLIVGEEFFNPKYKTADNAEYKFNGNSFDEDFIVSKGIFLTKINVDMKYLTERIIIFHHFTKFKDYELRNSKFYIKENEKYIPDNFDDEIALGIITEKGLVVIVGCSHVGIVNMLLTISEKMTIPIYGVIGGTHLIDADELRIKKTISAFKEMNIQLIAVSHCTGEQGIRLMREEFGENFLYNNTGNIIEI